MNIKHILFAAAAALSLAANAREECYMHYQPGETSVHAYSGRYYRLNFSRLPGQRDLFAVHGVVWNRVGDIVPMSGTEIRNNGQRIIAIDGLLRQHTQPDLRPPEPFYHVLRHIEIPMGDADGWVETANDNNFYQPVMKETGEEVPRGNDGVGLFPITRVSCDELPAAGGDQ